MFSEFQLFSEKDNPREIAISMGIHEHNQTTSTLRVARSRRRRRAHGVSEWLKKFLVFGIKSADLSQKCHHQRRRKWSTGQAIR
jgi:hypothetical protein